MTRKLLAPACIAMVAVSAYAQNATTSVRGIVTDPSGAIITGGTVTLTDPQSQSDLTSPIGKGGEYSFNQVKPSTYKIRVNVPGFSSVEQTTELLVSQPATINFKLTVGAEQTTVEVTAAAPLNFTDATIGNAISNAQIETMPIDSRNVADLLSLQPGVLYFGGNGSASNPAATTDSRLGAVAGARSDQGNITLDGLDDNDQTFGYAFTGVLRSTIDSTEEYRVTTASANADAGRSSGAQITLVTKTGTNKFHGSAYEYWRNRYFAANDWFNKRSVTPNKPPQLTRNTFGGTIGGPILRDKVFFFFNYEGQRTRESSPVTQEVPTDSYRAGNIIYKDTNGAVQTLSPTQVAALDNPCIANGVCTTPGPSAAVLAYFALLPHANGTSLGDGLNEGSYQFSSAAPYTHNTSILKFDWTPGSKHRIFVRGNLQKDVISGTQQFPGLPPSTATLDNTKGIAGGDTWTVTPSIVNDIRYGYIRQGFGTVGLGVGAYTDIRFIATPTAETRNTIRSVPINTISDTLSYSKGNHSIQVGGSWRLIHNNSLTDANSWNAGSTNPQGLTTNGLPSPTTIGLTGVATSFASNYLNAYGNLVGAESSLTQNVNYQVNSLTSGSLLAQGAPVKRAFVSNEFEYFLQDSWRATPKLTVTFGIRHSILQVPYESHGQSAAPTIDTHSFLLQRAAAAAQGVAYEPALQFQPNGPLYGRPGYWAKDKADIAPRISFAYAIDSKTSIRAGAGMYYDHFGQGVINGFNSKGSFGLASSIPSALGKLSPENAPRFVNRTTLPAISVTTPSSSQTFPYTPPTSNFSISAGIDNKIKTPYSEVFNLSIQRSLPGGFTFEADYVGRFGRRLVQQLDLATPVNLADPASGSTYFKAGAQLAALVDSNVVSDATAAHKTYKTAVPTIAYFENIFPQMKNLVIKNAAGTTTYNGAGLSATQNIYNLEFTTYRTVLGESTALADLDFYCSYSCPANAPQNRFFQGQFSSLYAQSTIGSSSYNAGQFILRHRLSHGFQSDLSYTLGNSIDMGSDTERDSFALGGVSGYITNAFNPSQSRGVSDFDTRHLITFTGSYVLPFGHGRAFGGNSSKLTDLLIGGWRVANISRWTSGLPFSLGEGGYTTDWEIGSYAIKTGSFSANTQGNATRAPNAFGATLASAINSTVTSGTPYERLPYPGEAGQRNNFRRDGYFGADASLTKPFKFTDNQLVQFAWEVFNVSNSVRFNALTTNTTSTNLGNYTSTLTTARRMQFSLRYQF